MMMMMMMMDSDDKQTDAEAMNCDTEYEINYIYYLLSTLLQ
jgi:hypothetical protein